MTATRSLIALCALLAACGASEFLPDSNPGNDASSGDAGCSTYITFDPDNPVAGPSTNVRAVANANGAPGVLTYSWQVSLDGNPVDFTYAASDNSQINFIASTAGAYDVQVDIGGGSLCPVAQQFLDVSAPGANTAQYRLRVVAPPNQPAPPQEQTIQVSGGANFATAVTLDGGVTATGQVMNGGTGVPAFLRFMPTATPYAAVEAFTASDGTFSVLVLGQPHDVLVVPTVPGVAPRVIHGWTPANTLLPVDAGSAVTGTVKDPTGAALANAKVQLSIAGTPSTLTTTDAGGNFTVRAVPVSGALVEVDVTPPPGKGLPRLVATSSSFDLAAAMAVKYAATVATCDLAGTTVKRGATSLANARVVVVCQLAAIGTVTAGVAATASGSASIAASADGTGKLPSMLVPKAPLSAVVFVTNDDLAVASIDLSTCATVAISAPAMITATGTVSDSTQDTLPGVQLEAVPDGALALAGATSIEAASIANGAFSLTLASGGHYDVHFADPAGRGAPLVATNVTAATVPGAAVLPLALRVSGNVKISGQPNPVANASVQVLCVGCTGIDLERPIGEAATDQAGTFSVAVPDPGVM